MGTSIYLFGCIGSSLFGMTTADMLRASPPNKRGVAASPLTFKFTVGANNIVVKELGRWMRNGNQGTHSVKLANGSGTDISGASVSVNSGIGQPGAFNYVTLSSPVTLLANTSYYLTSQEVNGGDEWYEYDSALTSSGVATIDNAVWALNSSTSYAQVGSAGNSYVPVSLKYEIVGWTAAGETRYVYDGMLPIQERDAHNVPVVTYTRGTDLSGSRQGAGGIGGLLARTDHREPSPDFAHAFYHADGSGNITAMVNSKQFVVAKYVYDPYGNTLAKAGPLAEANTYRFSSKAIHEASGNYYYGFRFYDPNLQRWLNRDPIGEAGGINVYSFAQNAPHRIDPFGLITIGFYGFDGWLPGKNPGNERLETINSSISDAEPLFESLSVSAAFNHLLKELDSNGDGVYDQNDKKQDIKIYGWSWGGASAVQLAKRIQDSPEFCIKDIKVLATIDPVLKGRKKKAEVPSNVAHFFNRYQTKGPGVPLKFYGQHYNVAQGVNDSQLDLNSGNGRTALFGNPVPIDHMNILWVVEADLLKLLN